MIERLSGIDHMLRPPVGENAVAYRDRGWATVNLRFN
jgi:hypothetical protein